MKAATGSSGAFFEIERISIHAAREGGDFAYERKAKISFISIHAAREGGDLAVDRVTLDTTPFQSTPPVKAATK